MVASSGTESSDGAPVGALSFTNLSKVFGGTKALDKVDFHVDAGEICGLVGRNGSGKSTLIKILSGYHDPEPGASLSISGEPVSLPLHPAQLDGLGLRFVHQDLGLSPAATVLENIRITEFATSVGGRIRWKEERQLVAAALTRFGVDVDPDVRVGALREVDRAQVAIVRALMGLEDGQGLLVLDEPTAYLPRDSVNRLFDTVRHVASTGTGVIFVSHRLDEVMALTDRVVALRDGRMAGSVDTASSSEDEVIELILGRSIEGFYPEDIEHEVTRTLLEVIDLGGATVHNLSFDLRAGEVLGLTGLAGAGHEEVPYLLFGSSPASSGSVRIQSDPVPLDRLSPGECISRGMVLLPADRAGSSGALDATISENMSLPVLGRFFQGGRLRQQAERSAVLALLKDFDVRPAVPLQLLGALSGGNQQKALLAKWMQMEPPVLLLHEPTQGVDVAAKKEIFGRIQAASVDGSAVLVTSNEYEDLAHICDRVLVFNDGVLVGELTGDELTEDRIVERCYRPAIAEVR